MSTQINCPQCGYAIAEPRDGAKGVRCPHCAARIPSASASGTSVPSPGNAGAAAEQWFVTFPDGRRFGPLTGDQIRSAAQRGTVPAGALVRRGDWSEAVLLSDLLTRQEPFAAPTRATKESYGRQFARNPLGTYFFGPQLAAYEGNRDQGVQATRRRHFRRWLYLLMAMFLSAALLPPLAGLLRGDPRLAGGGLVLGLMAFFWPTVFFLLGLLMYAGALFEWQWFFRSRTLRHARGMFGESGARKFYLGFGGVLMGGGTLFSLGGSWLIAGGILFSSAKQPPAAGQPRAGQLAIVAENLATYEKPVQTSRQRLDKTAQTLSGLVRQTERFEADIGEQPNELSLREQLLRVQEGIASVWKEYRQARAEWERCVANLEAVVRRTRGQSDVLDANQRLPAEHDFSEAILVQPTDKFPLQNVRITISQWHRGEANVRQSASSAGRMPTFLAPAARQLDQLRTYLEEVEQKWGYHAPELDTPPSEQWLAQCATSEGNENSAAPPASNAPPPRAGIVPPSPTRPPDVGAPGDLAPASGVPPGAGNQTSPLSSLDPERDAIFGTVRLEGAPANVGVITEGLSEHVLVRLPIDLPAKYAFECDVTRLVGEGGFFFVVPLAGSPTALVIDGGDELGHRTGLVAVDRQVLSSPKYPPNVLEGTQLPRDQRVHIRCVVEGQRLEFYVRGQLVYRWDDDPRRLSLPPFYRSGHPASLHLGSFHSRFRVQALRVRPD